MLASNQPNSAFDTFRSMSQMRGNDNRIAFERMLLFLSNKEIILLLLISPVFFKILIESEYTTRGREAWDIIPYVLDDEMMPHYREGLFKLALIYLNPAWTEQFDLPKQYRSEVLFRWYQVCHHRKWATHYLLNDFAKLTSSYNINFESGDRFKRDFGNLTYSNYLNRDLSRVHSGLSGIVTSDFLERAKKVPIEKILGPYHDNSSATRAKIMRLNDLVFPKRLLFYCSITFAVIAAIVDLCLLAAGSSNAFKRSIITGLSLLLISIVSAVILFYSRKFDLKKAYRLYSENILETVLKEMKNETVPASVIGQGAGMFDRRLRIADEEQGVTRTVAVAGPANADEEMPLLAKEDSGAGVFSSGYGSFQLSRG